MKIKICGITSLEDALCAVHAGADALGFVFYDKSPRYIDPNAAKKIIRALPPFINSVGLFVNQTPEVIKTIVQQTHINTAQLHGDETPEAFRSFDFPFIRATRVNEDSNLATIGAQWQQAGACGHLLDAFSDTQYGGTGKSFNWKLIPKESPLPLILAGGLTPDNVQSSLDHFNGWGIDVSSGVEQQPGVKSHQKIIDFIHTARSIC